MVASSLFIVDADYLLVETTDVIEGNHFALYKRANKRGRRTLLLHKKNAKCHSICGLLLVTTSFCHPSMTNNGSLYILKLSEKWSRWKFSQWPERLGSAKGIRILLTRLSRRTDPTLKNTRMTNSPKGKSNGSSSDEVVRRIQFCQSNLVPAPVSYQRTDTNEKDETCKD